MISLRPFATSLAGLICLAGGITLFAQSPEAPEVPESPETAATGEVSDAPPASPEGKGGVMVVQEAEAKPRGEKPEASTEDKPEAAAEMRAKPKPKPKIGPAPTISPNAAGFALYRTLIAHPGFLPDDGNLVLSPAGLEPVLLALEAGAGGETAAQLDNILRPKDELKPRKVTPTAAGDTGAKISAAGAWIEMGWLIKPEYEGVLSHHLGMSLSPAAFSEDAAGETEKINSWVNAATRERIPTLFESGDLDSTTRLVIACALAYDGAWVNPFDPTYTKPGEFHSGSGKTVRTDFMHQVAEFQYREIKGTHVLAMPLQNGDQRCVFLLPPDGGDPLVSLQGLEKTLTAARFQELTEDLERHTVELKTPRLKLEVQSSVKAGLQILGAGSLFSPQEADLSGISDEQGLCVSVLRHKATLELDETGARGAAATGAAVATRGWPDKPIALTLDRPFVVAIQSTETGEVLFLARIVSPEPAAPANNEAISAATTDR